VLPGTGVSYPLQNSKVIGIDLAKHVIQVCRIDKQGELESNRAMSPNKLKALLPWKAVAHVINWARLARSHGHDVRIISPGRVKAFVQGHKTDANDALAVAIAATQFGRVFSQIKEEEQQSLQTLETRRKFLDKALIALNNPIRAYLYE